jgi:hypothetical protein
MGHSGSSLQKKNILFYFPLSIFSVDCVMFSDFVKVNLEDLGTHGKVKQINQNGARKRKIKTLHLWSVKCTKLIQAIQAA